MSAPVDVHRHLIWGRHKAHRARLRMALIGIVAAVVVAVIADKAMERHMAWAAFAFLSVFAGHEIYRLRRPGKTMIELVPQGIIFRFSPENYIVPWTEIRGIDSITIKAATPGRTITIENVTVILVSRFFYDRVIHVDNWFVRTPLWNNTYVPKGDDLMQIALHHDALAATAEEIRREVEARWKAFGNGTPAAAKP